MFIDVLIDSLIDTLKMLPFLLAAFFLLEYMEHRAGKKTVALLSRAGKAGPLAGAALGLIPQCGFSVIGSNFFSDKIVSMGTLLAIFLSTSDEAVIILLSDPKRIGDVLFLLAVKFVIAVTAGYAVDCIFKKHRSHDMQEHHEHCHEGCGCSCNSSGAFWKNALLRTLSVWVFLFAASFVLGLLIELLGEDSLRRFLLTDSIFQPILTGIVGLIPNCAASAVIAQMYIDGAISMGAAVSGLCSSAGLGLLVLFRTNRNIKENFLVLGLLYLIGAVSGMLVEIII